MKKPTSTNDFNLISKIPAAMQPPLAEFSLEKESGILKFTAGNLIVRLTQCWKNSKMEGGPDSIILDAELMKLDLNHRVLALHSAAARRRLLALHHQKRV